MHQVPVTIIAVIGIQSLTLTLLLLRKGKENQANLFLALVLFFYTLSSLNVALFYILNLSDLTNLIPFFQLELLYGLGPAIYFYTKLITDPNYKFKKSDFLHFIPVLIEFIYYRTGFFRYGSMELISDPSTISNWFFLGIQWIGVFSVSIYILFSIKILFTYKAWVRNNYSNLDHKNLGWLEKPIIVYALFWALWISLRLADLFFFGDTLRTTYFLPGIIVLSIITCWIGFKGYLKAQIDVAGFSTAKKTKRVLTEEEKVILSDISVQLKDFMEKEKAFLNPNLSLALLSEKTGIKTDLISRVINSEMGINFHEFVNQYRVEEFMKNVEEDTLSHLNLLGIAFESGFNSKSTFNLVFKKLSGKTPRQYVNRLHKK